jgi:hypothetical protein
MGSDSSCDEFVIRGKQDLTTIAGETRENMQHLFECFTSEQLDRIVKEEWNPANAWYGSFRDGQSYREIHQPALTRIACGQSTIVMNILLTMLSVAVFGLAIEIDQHAVASQIRRLDCPWRKLPSSSGRQLAKIFLYQRNK